MNQKKKEKELNNQLAQISNILITAGRLANQLGKDTKDSNYDTLALKLAKIGTELMSLHFNLMPNNEEK